MSCVSNMTENNVQPESQAALISGLPDDIALLCLARVPRNYHHVLRCVSKKWRALLGSKEWHMSRKKNNLEETWIYVVCRENLKGNLCFVLDPDPANRSWKLLQSMPPACSKKDGISIEALGTKLYLLGGCSWQEDATNEVYSYDTSTNHWDAALSMPTARCFFVSASLEEKIYVTGGLGLNSVAPSSYDIFDLDSNSWSSHQNLTFHLDIIKFISSGGKLYTVHKTWNGLHYAGLYDPSSGTWQSGNNEMAKCSSGPTVIVDGTLYMLDESLGIKLLMWQNESNDWISLGRLSHHLIRPPCQLVAIGKRIFVIGQGLSTVVIDVDNLVKGGQILVSFSFHPNFECDHTVISCKTIAV